MSILGNRVRRVEDPRLLTAGGTYAADVVDDLLSGAAHVAYVRSTIAHASITGIDTSEAQAAPGVVAVLTHADLDLPAPEPAMPFYNPAMTRPLLAADRVRFAGEPVAVVVADSPAEAEDAAELVIVDYDELEPVTDPVAAAAEGSPLLFPEAGTNVAFDIAAMGAPAVDADGFFDDCEVVVELAIRNQRVAGAPLEVRSAAAGWADDGRLHLWTSTQTPQQVRDVVVGGLGLEPGSVRVIAPDVGGGFGPKIGAYPEEVLLGWLARRVGRPVRWTETRTENMLAMGQGRDQLQTVTIGGSRDGRVQAYSIEVVHDCGAYPALGAFLPFLTHVMALGVYDIAKVRTSGRSVVTNKVSTVAYRGAGRPEATAAIERAMDRFAAEIDMDPADVRARNLIGADLDDETTAFPATTPTGATYDIGAYGASLDLLRRSAGYDDLRAEQTERRQRGDTRQLGLGLGVYVEVTAGPTAGEEQGKVEIEADGSATVYTGTSPHGQGHATAWAMIASEELGIPMDRVRVVHGDTDLVPVGVGTFGSRSLQLGGSAVWQASQVVIEKAKTLTALLLEANVDDVELDKAAGRFQVVGTPSQGRDWAELAQASTTSGGLSADEAFKSESPTYPFGAHLAVVEVDTETGHVELTRFIAVDDAGKILNPLLAEGQRHGGIAQGVAQALLEEVIYDEFGNPQTTNFADYAFVTAAELPTFELVPMETPTPMNPLGAKGIGESGTIGSTPAVHNAVVDALTHLGVRHVDMPTTPERVWRALADASS